MNYIVNKEFVKLCKLIADENKSSHEWGNIESDDMFQIGNIVGGYDATEKAFCFSISIDSKEYWAQISLEIVNNIANGDVNEIIVIPSE